MTEHRKDDRLKKVRHPAVLIGRVACCALLLAAGSASQLWAADVLVVCPEQFRESLRPWVDHRQSEGLTVELIDSAESARALQRAICAAADSRTRYVVLVGDSPVIGLPCNSTRQVPVHYAAAKVTVAWGSPPTLATDLPFGDFDGDQFPDAVVGRLPVDRPAQLSELIVRIIAQEQSEDFGRWRGQVQLTGGVGGFGLLADAAIESVTRTVVTSVLPVETSTSVIYASPGHRFFPTDRSFTDAVLARYQLGARFWVYAGHGQITALDRVPGPNGSQPVLDQQSVKLLQRPSGGSPIAVMLACYTGAIDASEDSLAEEMLFCQGGPIAVFAGSRVTMPYGNATAAVGLIHGVFEQRLPRLGDAWLSTLHEMHRESDPDQTSSRVMIDTLASVVSPSGTSLVSERREHMLLYNLIGDPTLKLRHPEMAKLDAEPGYDAGQPIRLSLISPIDGELTLSLDRPLGAVAEGDPNATTVGSHVSTVTAGQVTQPQVSLPEDVTGPILVRAIISGKGSWATAAARTIIRAAK